MADRASRVAVTERRFSPPWTVEEQDVVLSCEIAADRRTW
jgi:hypothetical protein